MQELRTVQVTRYITPLREGGSLPAIAEADDNFMYVIKFRGAGQGVKALIAEYIGGEVARKIGLKVPEIVFADLDEAFGRTEPDEEIQDLLKASVGLNLGLHYLSGAVTFDPVVSSPDEMLASKIVWLDSYLKNVDRTSRNTNMLNWKKELWLIDHGAALYFHHNWEDAQDQASRAFPMIRDHVLLALAGKMKEADEEARQFLNEDFIRDLVEGIPADWLLKDVPFKSIDEHRQAYIDYLVRRLEGSGKFINEILNARQAII